MNKSLYITVFCLDLLIEKKGSWGKIFADEVFPVIDEERFFVLYSENEAFRTGGYSELIVYANNFVVCFQYRQEIKEKLKCKHFGA